MKANLIDYSIQPLRLHLPNTTGATLHSSPIQCRRGCRSSVASEALEGGRLPPGTGVGVAVGHLLAHPRHVALHRLELLEERLPKSRSRGTV